MDLRKPKRLKPPLTPMELLYELVWGGVGVTVAYALGATVAVMLSEDNIGLLILFVFGGLVWEAGTKLSIYTILAWGMIAVVISWRPQLWRSWGVVVLYGAIGLVGLGLYTYLTSNLMPERVFGNIAIPLALQSVIIMVVPYWRFAVLRR